MNSPESWEEICSLRRLLELHTSGIAKFGGVEGVRDAGCPEGTLGAAWSAVGYEEIENSLPQLVFAARVLYYFATKQCFADGNKRIAWLATCEVLATIGLQISATQAEVVEFVLSIANRQVDYEATRKWIFERVVELPAAAGAQL